MVEGTEYQLQLNEAFLQFEVELHWVPVKILENNRFSTEVNSFIIAFDQMFNWKLTIEI